jgi:2-oxo-4-hydroxy-4-carboxy-5-ureidoimidazoline decarboxylase
MEPWRKLDLAGAEDARRLLTTCCGSTQWVESMMERRPFGSADGLQSAAHESWLALEPDDWREAFAEHP